ncbi:hypothetical protein ACETKS_002008 [Escherichia coli]|uniref:hypothetical protein n=1 Tax=Escherichia coli TaxID=562 RepID=UPI000BE56148|nr:hypothetical protein [Escherichia coli]HBA8085931.1 hypothetical protein [Escherichia coli]HBB0008729.1 hypothetical protein [Escherichia coli]
MQKREPIIIAPGYTDDEICEWILEKALAITELKSTNEAIKASIDSVDTMKRIATKLAGKAALNIQRS